MTMTNSHLATYRHITKNKTALSNKHILRITPHYMAAYWTGEHCADYFASTDRQASSNYCIGYNGDIAISVDEKDRAWTSSDWDNDSTAITIECANNKDSSLPKATYDSLVSLCADICTRYGIKPHYNGKPSGTITMHKMFASTSCPGAWLTAKITSGQFEKDIKAKMTKAPSKPSSNTSANIGKMESYSGYVKVIYSGSDGLAYHSKASWDDNTIKGIAKKGEIFTIVGRQKVDGVYMYKLKSGYYITSSTTYVQYLKTLPKAQPKKKSVDEVAREVINGKWGNGSDRVSRLKKAGYDPVAVQKRVNNLLG